jgi:hypothetical protein
MVAARDLSGELKARLTDRSSAIILIIPEKSRLTVRGCGFVKLSETKDPDAGPLFLKPPAHGPCQPNVPIFRKRASAGIAISSP